MASTSAPSKPVVIPQVCQMGVWTSAETVKDFNAQLYTPLKDADPEIADLISKETWRQFSGLELIASENLTSYAVNEANGSILTNKYSEDYGGNEYIDQLELLAQRRALTAFHLDNKSWGDTPKRKISASSIYFQSLPYQVDPKTGLIDYDLLERNANLFKPRILICGGSAYPRDWDYARLRKIADAQGAYLMMDMAHISGLVAAQVQNNPFEYCDVVCTTTHKTLRGPRAGLIFFRKDKESDMETRINNAVFPACQGGPHNNTIAGIAVALKQAAEPEFKKYAIAVIENSRAIAESLVKKGYKLQTDGTDNHLNLWDLRPLGLTGSKVEKVCDLAHITINKNSVVGDVSAATPGGVRVGTAAVTSRSMGVNEMAIIADFLDRAVQISLKLQQEAGKKLVDFIRAATEGNGAAKQELEQLSKDVEAFATQWPLPGILDTSAIKRPEVLANGINGAH